MKGYKGGICPDDEVAMIQAVKDHHIKTLLEFGPGKSTEIWLAAGVKFITTCEHDPRWRDRARAMFAGQLSINVRGYENTPEIVIPELEGKTFDAIFVDSPAGYDGGRMEHPDQEGCARLNTLRFAVRHTRGVVLLHDARRPGEQKSLFRIASEGCFWDMIETKKGIARVFGSEDHT